MNLTVIEAAVWLISIGINPLLVAFIVKRRAAARFPFLFSLLVFEVFRSPLLFALHTHYAAYFYTYWITFPFEALLRLAITIDVARTIPEFQLTSRETLISFLIVSVMIVGGCVYLSGQASIPGIPSCVAIFLNVDRGVAITWLLFPLLTYFLLGTMGMGWTQRGQRVGLANVLLAAVSLAANYCITLWPARGILIDMLETIPTCAIWLYIGWAVAGPEPAPFVVTKELREEYRRLLSEYRF